MSGFRDEDEELIVDVGAREVDGLEVFDFRADEEFGETVEWEVDGTREVHGGELVDFAVVRAHCLEDVVGEDGGV